MTDHEAPATAESGRELITRRELARRMNVAPSYVMKLCAQGVISIWVECPACGSTCNSTAANCSCGEAIAGVVDAGKGKVDAALALLELERARHPEKAHVTARHAEARGDAPASSQPPAGELPLGEPGDDPDVISYAAEKARRERAQANIAELDYQKRIGQLGELDAMHRRAFQVARQVRDSLTSMPDRLAPVLAAERDEARVHGLLLEEITRVLDELHRNIGAESERNAG